MVATLNDGYRIVIERIDEPMHWIDTAGPVSLVIEAQRLGFADTLLRFLANR